MLRIDWIEEHPKYGRARQGRDGLGSEGAGLVEAGAGGGQIAVRRNPADGAPNQKES
jgi:hypothetical protein